MSLETIPRRLSEALLPFQNEGIRRALSLEGRVLVGDEMVWSESRRSLPLTCPPSSPFLPPSLSPLSPPSPGGPRSPNLGSTAQ